MENNIFDKSNERYEQFMDYAEYVYPKHLNMREHETLIRYTATFYDVLNKSLRTGKGLKESKIKQLDRAISKFEFDGEGIVYRTLDIESFNLDAFLSDLDKGYIIERGYLSTSLNKMAKDKVYNVKFNIEVPDINVGAYIKFLSAYPEEKEFLIKRDTKMDILDVTSRIDHKENKRKIYVKSRIVE